MEEGVFVPLGLQGLALKQPETQPVFRDNLASDSVKQIV